MLITRPAARAAAKVLLQRRSYYPSSEKASGFTFEVEQERWKDSSVKTRTVSELYSAINGPLTECEDIMSTWRDTKWFNRDVEPHIKTYLTDFLRQKYDHGQEVNFLDRLLLQYAMMTNGNFENAFHGYFRNANGVVVYDQERRWDTVRRLLLTNVPVIDDLFRLSGMSPGTGYRGAFARMIAASLEHAIPTGKSNVSDYAKILFQHRQDGESGHSVVRVFSSVSDSEGIDFMLVQPAGEGPGRHRLTLLIIGSENKYRRQVQVPDPARQASMCRRAEKVLSLPTDSVSSHILLSPPWCCDRHTLLKAHTLVGGLAPVYADWLPYYHYTIPASDADWAYQAKKDAEDEYYQL
ncbi:hypothetical protein DIPPA_11421 [Diplonema papillatum]|nr:hypothetical protein DIPPA_11421 [Diplonema papillatum]KAJ9459763.1 hypothetical protein DIPPA_11421 [Diplonema papillatum]